MDVMGRIIGWRWAMTSVTLTAARFINEALSFIAFSVLDLLDFLLCYVYRVMDFLMEAEWKPCYCSSPKEAIGGGGSNILVLQERGESKIVSLTSTRLHLEEISETLYSRPSLAYEFSKLTFNVLIKRLKLELGGHRYHNSVINHHHPRHHQRHSNDNISNHTSETTATTTLTSHIIKKANYFTVNSTVVEMLQGKINGRQHMTYPIPRWSDCDCKLCTSWTTHSPSSSSSSNGTLFVRVHGPATSTGAAAENVIFIHGFISSSLFWTETLFPNFSSTAKSAYRFIAVDLLGFGRSPKPTDSLYTLREHLDMIERSVLEPYNLKSFHIVAHSLGCILALALAVKHPQAVNSLTLLAPPYYPVPKGAQATQYVMRKIAPRRVWPPIAFGASIACWYEHISRTICLIICKNHRLWEFLTKLVTRNRMRTFLMEGFFCHTHNAAWHTLHNIICGAAGKMEVYLDTVRERLTCSVTIYHGQDDELIPVECSYNVQNRIPRAHVNVIPNKDHITIVVGRQTDFATELEHIWTKSPTTPNALIS